MTAFSYIVNNIVDVNDIQVEITLPTFNLCSYLSAVPDNITSMSRKTPALVSPRALTSGNQRH